MVKPFISVYFLLLECNSWSQISLFVLILVPLERNWRLLAEITLRTWFATFGLLVIYRTAIISAYLTVRVNLGLARFRNFVCSATVNSSALAFECREKLATASPRA